MIFGVYFSHHEPLILIDSLAETITHFNEQIGAACVPFEAALLDTLPGVARQRAETIVAEIGPDMGHFHRPAHLASWAGLAPRRNESVGKRRLGKTRQGNRACGWRLAWLIGRLP